MRAQAIGCVFLLMIGTTACGGPFVLLPGGELDGSPAEHPTSWAFTDDISTVQLETRPTDPYSVNIWATGVGDVIYVHAGDNRSTWVEHMEADPRVRLRVDDSLYALSAHRVESQQEFDRFSAAYEEKYGRAPGNGDVGEAYLFRLDAR